jgi:hypothetical protein
MIKNRDLVKAGKQTRFENRGEIYKSIRETGFISLQKTSDGTDPARFCGRFLDENLTSFDLVADWL